MNACTATHPAFSEIRGVILTVVILLLFQAASAQTGEMLTREKALSDFAVIEAQNRFIDRLGIGSGENEAYNLPIGVKKTIGNIPFMVAITDVKVGAQYGQATVIMKMRPPQGGRELIFGATDVTLSYKGDLVGDITLSLLSDVPLSLGNMGDLVFKGGFDRERGTSTSGTYVSLDCNGNFKELSVAADITLNKNTFRLAGRTPDEAVTASFRTVISDWNDLYVNIGFPPFEIKGAKDFEFALANATLDLSDLRNPVNFNPVPGYMQEYFTLPNPLLWRGLYIENFSVTFPEQFKRKKTNERLRLEASRLLIDENGISGDITGRNILPFEQGDASGWAFSVTDFRLSLLANNIKGFGFGGQIDVPLGAESQPRDYEAYISNNDYLIKVGLGSDMDCNIFGTAKLRLEPTSYLQVAVKNRRFCPRVVLNGAMAFDSDGLKIEELTFTKLSIGTQSPVLSVESMGYGGEVKYANFPVTISDIRASLNDRQASLGFDVKINLMKEHIAAGSRINIASEHIDEEWQFKGVSIDAITLEDVQMAGFTLDGQIRMEKNHPVYGNYFGGDITAVFDALSNDLTVNVTAVFGCKDYRYWYVEGKAMFRNGIPIGPFRLNGFTGGAYYRMAATGGKGFQAYAPDDRSSLGVKAGVAYGVSGNVVTGTALFEMNFLSSGGIKNMKFYGTAEMMAGVEIGVQIEGLDKLREEVQQKSPILSESLAAALPGNMSGSDVAKDVLAGVRLAAGINAYLTIDYDFTIKVFDADFKLMVSTPGNFIRGAGNNNEAGWAKLHFSPQSWYIHAGTPTNPIGLDIGLGPVSLSTHSYIMLGDKLENPAAPPRQVLDILKITPEQADYMKYPEMMAAGKGVAFGTHLSFDTGNLRFLILYARFMAGVGVDFMLRDMSNYACEGSSEPVGINGWYANGQCYAYLSGELGVNIKLFFINKKIVIIKGSTAALLQARLPNPTWVGGSLAVNLNVLGGLIKASMKMKMSFGDDCKLVALNGDSSPLDMPLIAGLSPLDNDTGVDVFQSPQATFNMPLSEAFDMEDDKGELKTYRIKLEDFYVADTKGQRVEGKIEWNRSNDAATFEAKEILPPYMNMKVYVSVNFEEYTGGSWKAVTRNGSPARESRESLFKTGGAPNYIPLANIEYCYPVISQKNFYRNEATAGYVQLKKGQTYLFPENFDYNTNFTARNGNTAKAAFRYSSSDSRLNFNFPAVENRTDYELAFVASTSATSPAQTPAVKKESVEISDGEGETFVVDYRQQAAQKIVRDGTMEVLKYSFRSSGYNTLAEKLASMRFTPAQLFINDDTRALFLKTGAAVETFDIAELSGSEYTGDKPLMEAEAIPDDNYYKLDIEPAVYRWYPVGNIRITWRDTNVLGVPPVRAFTLYDGYVDMAVSGTYHPGLSQTFPIVYNLSYIYYRDYYELQGKAFNRHVNKGGLGADYEKLKPLLNGFFPFIRQGDYKARIRYVLPGGNPGKTVRQEINYTNTLDWRK